jgi:hypothetical protein
MKWETPKLVELHSQTASGVCDEGGTPTVCNPGSGYLGSCGNGGTPEASCIDGTTAIDDCTEGSNVLHGEPL